MKWLEDAELRRMTGTEDATESDIEEAQAMYQTDEDNYGLLIMRKEIETESPPVGDIYLFIQDVPTEDIYERYGELNVSIADKSCRQQGLAKEAVASIILWAYRELELCRFFVKINEENSASISLFKKLGFQVVNTNTVFHELELRISLNEELKQKLLDIVQ